MSSDALRGNQRMVDRLVAEGCLWSRPLIDAFRATPRHCFLPRIYHFQQRQNRWQLVPLDPPNRGGLRLIYSDRALITRLSESRPPCPISSSSQPSLMAQILEDLHLQPGLRVLEIGAGVGYNAALLAHVVGPITSLEIDRRVLAEAAQHLSGFPELTVKLVHGDGREGHARGAPFDRILATAATPDLEPAWLEQAGDGGWVQAPLALAPGLAFMVQGVCRDGVFTGSLRRAAYFMPLRGERGPDALDPTLTGLLPDPSHLEARPAPWDEPSGRGPDLLQALAFLGWLEGLSIDQRFAAGNLSQYGVADLVRGHGCWMGRREWRVTGAAGLEMGLRLWQRFLDGGGLWPTEFRLVAAALSRPPATPEGPLVFLRQGPRCAQVWQWAGRRRDQD
jgi:protein-L-isoaspartate O-methyltransferase